MLLGSVMREWKQAQIRDQRVVQEATTASGVADFLMHIREKQRTAHVFRHLRSLSKLSSVRGWLTDGIMRRTNLRTMAMVYHVWKSRCRRRRLELQRDVCTEVVGRRACLGAWFTRWG